MNGNFSVRPGFNLIITDVIGISPFIIGNETIGTTICKLVPGVKTAGTANELEKLRGCDRGSESADSFSPPSLSPHYFCFLFPLIDFVPHERPRGGGHSYDHMKGAGRLIVSLTNFWDFGLTTGVLDKTQF